MASEEPILRYNVSDFNDNDQQHDFHEHGEPSNQSESSSYLKLQVANFQKIKSTQILIKIEGVLVQMTFMKA